MNAWLEIDAGADGCQINLVAPTDSLPMAGPGLTLPVLAGISAIQRPLSIPGVAPAPTSSMDAQLDNARGVLTRLWGQNPPLRRAARVRTDAGVVFEGITTTLQAGVQLTIGMESGADRPLSDNLPLRTNAVWGGWKDVKVLPWVWGGCTLAPIQYSEDQRTFVLADHPIAGVDQVTRDDVPTAAYAWYNGVDSTGRAVAFLELAQPLADGERLAATVRGRMHPDTGHLLQTPAEILHDLLANLARAPVQWSDLDDYRTQTQEWVLGGLLDDNAISIRAAVDGLMQSCGGAWSAAMPGIAMAWPAAADPAAPAQRVDELTATDLQAGTDATGIYTSLRVLYDYDHAAQRYRRAIQLQAPDAIKAYGTLEMEWTAPWLRTPRHAEQLGQRMLSWLARPRWRVTWRQSFADVPTGAWVDVTHAISPVHGRHRLVSAELDLSGAQLSCAIESPVGDAPLIETARLSTAFEPVIQPGITVEIANGEIIFTARDEQGNAIAGAAITLDGGLTRIADAAGRVSFPVQRGRHTLRIEAQGYAPAETIVVI